MAGEDEDLRALNPSDGRNLQYARLLFEALGSRPPSPVGVSPKNMKSYTSTGFVLRG